MKTAKTTKIDPDVLRVLRSLEWDGDRATFQQIPRDLYVRVNTVLEALGGKWVRKAKAHVFDSPDAREALENLLEIGEFTSVRDLRRTFGEFQTPEDLADELVAWADIRPGQFVLEPSAGGGRLVRAIRKAHGDAVHITAVEVQSKFRTDLTGLTNAGATGDFLQWAPPAAVPRFDRVVMNPPFGGQVEVDHVAAAYALLKPGGVLVAILPCSVLTRDNRKGRAFNELYERGFGTWRKNADDAFETEGTGVRTIQIRLVRAP